MKRKINCHECARFGSCPQQYDPWGLKGNPNLTESRLWCKRVWELLEEEPSNSVASFPCGHMVEKVVVKKGRDMDIFMLVASLYLLPKDKRKSPHQIARALSIPVGRVYDITRKIRRQLKRKGLRRD